MRLDGYGLFVKDMPAMIRFYRDVLGFEIKEDENTSNVYLLKDGTLFCFMEEKIVKSAQAKNTSIHKRPLTFAPDVANHKFIFIPYKSRHDFCHYPTTNLFVFFRYFAGIGASNLHVMFMGLEPLCET